MTIQQAFELALGHHQAGRLAEADALYRQVLATDPRHADSLHLLGIIAHQGGRHDIAADLIRRAIALKPDVPEAHRNLGVSLHGMGQVEEAIAAIRQAIALNAADAEAHANLGAALHDAGQLDGAIAAYRQAIGLQPNFPEACAALGNALREAGQADEAVSAYRQAIALNPGLAVIHYNLGNALEGQGRLDEAITAYHRAIELQPDYAEAHNNLGIALKAAGRPADAEAAFRRALQLKPDYVVARFNLGGALSDQGRPSEAVAELRPALDLNPHIVAARSTLLCNLHYLPDVDPASLFREHCRWDEIHARPLARFIQPHTNDRNPERRLRIGYVSPDFRDHFVAFFFEPLLGNHDRERVETFCYADQQQADHVTNRLQQHAMHWRQSTGASDADLAGQIRRDGIDILVDLTGHMAHNRLLVFARKPAPVQVTWLGYADTTGLQTMDYRVTDAHADPVGSTEQFYTEQLVRLPDTFASFRPVEGSPAPGPLPALARGHVTFASFHRLAKLNDQLLGWWTSILGAVPGSRLLLASAGVDEAGIRRRLDGFFTTRGISPGRIEFAGHRSLAAYLALHDEADLLLDCHPFSGHTVCCHALWMGVPVVTLAGQSHRSRMVASVLTNAGLPGLIANTPEEYVRIASDLATDRPRLAQLRSELRGRMASSPLTNGASFARNMEDAFRVMWRKWCVSG